MILQYSILATLWIFYFTIHSLLASYFVKSWVEDKMPFASRIYRLFYNFIALAGLIFICYYIYGLPAIQILESNILIKYTGALFAFTGSLIVARVMGQHDMKPFIGIQPNEATQPFKKLYKEGLFGMVRHPVYFGTMVILGGYLVYNFTLAGLISVVLIFTYILIGIKIEERKLVEEFGNAYINYQKEVPMLVPFLKANN